MKNTDSVPRQDADETQQTPIVQQAKEDVQDEQSVELKKKKERAVKKKKKRNLWPLKALLITLLLSAAVNAASTVVLEKFPHLWLAALLTVLILLFGVIFDMVGTAATACDEGPFLSMASRKVRGAKLAVKLSKKSDVVSSVCCDIVGDICGIVSGVCAATIAVYTLNLNGSFWWTVLIYAVISTLTITLKAIGKGIAVKQANKIIFGVAKTLSIFRKEG